MTLQDEYTSTDLARRAQDLFTNATDTWSETFQKMTDQFGVVPVVTPTIPTELPTAFVEQWLDFNDRVTKVNRDYVLNLIGAFNAASGAVRQHVEGLGEVMRDQTHAVTQNAKEQLDKVASAEVEVVEKTEELQREAVERAEQAEREIARAARNAERQRVRQARQTARERYESLTKAELTEILASRELPKTGNVEDLIERLVDADLK